MESQQATVYNNNKNKTTAVVTKNERNHLV
jgi:hypothetical protein